MDSLALDAVWCKFLIMVLNCLIIGLSCEFSVFGPWTLAVAWRGGLAKDFRRRMVYFRMISGCMGIES